MCYKKYYANGLSTIGWTITYIHTCYIHVDAKLQTAAFISVDFGCNFQTYLTPKHCMFLLVNCLQCHLSLQTLTNLTSIMLHLLC